MGSAIAQQLKTDYQVWVFDQDKNKTAGLSGIKVAQDIQDLVAKSEVIILAVKPQDFGLLLGQINNSVKGKLIISIAAGIGTGHIEKALGEIRVIRTMPNIAARIGKGVTCLCRGRFASDDDLDFARELFDYVGKTLKIDEKMMNAATAVSGSGPGYFFQAVESGEEEYKNNRKEFMEEFIFSLTQAAESIGFNSEEARFLAKWTVTYSDALLSETHLSAHELKMQVASKGGTTEAALEILYKGGSLQEAVKAALRRAQDLTGRS